jgi:hypothetical protein
MRRDLIAGLVLPMPLLGIDEFPTQAWLEIVDAEGINTVFAPQVDRNHRPQAGGGKTEQKRGEICQDGGHIESWNHFPEPVSGFGGEGGERGTIGIVMHGQWMGFAGSLGQVDRGEAFMARRP